MTGKARWGVLAMAVAALAAPPGADGQTFTPDQLSRQPEVKSEHQAARAVRNEYPSVFQDNGIGGKVQLRFIVSETGAVVPNSVEVIAASVKALGVAATKAVMKIEFVPGQRDGVAVASLVVMPITFGVS